MKKLLIAFLVSTSLIRAMEHEQLSVEQIPELPIEIMANILDFLPAITSHEQLKHLLLVNPQFTALIKEPKLHKALLESVAKDLVTKNKDKAQHIFDEAAKKGDLELVAAFLKTDLASDRTHLGSLLLVLPEKNYKEIAEALIEHDAAINDFDPRTHDYFARASKPKTPLLAAIEKNSMPIVMLLLDRGADLDFEGDYPLTDAAKIGNNEIVELLLDRGARIDDHTGSGSSALMEATSSGNIGTVVLLLKRGASVHIKNVDRKTTLHGAAETGNIDIAQLLLKHGAIADINELDEPHQYTPLMLAVINDHPEMVRLLLENGAESDLKGLEGRTALRMARERRNVPIVNIIESFSKPSTSGP